MNQFLQQDIKYLSGVGPKRAELLNKELQVFTIEDLLRYYPYKYIDRSRIYHINEIDASLAYIQLRGKITGFKREGKRPKERLVARFTDSTGVVDLVFFEGLKYLLTNLKIDIEYILLGKPSLFSGQINIVHPELEEASKFDHSISNSLQPLYNTSEKLKRNYISSKVIQKLMNNLWQGIQGKIPETLSTTLLQQAKLISLHDALFNIHFPQSQYLLKKAQFRLKFEELFFNLSPGN